MRTCESTKPPEEKPAHMGGGPSSLPLIRRHVGQVGTFWSFQCRDVGSVGSWSCSGLMGLLRTPEAASLASRLHCQSERGGSGHVRPHGGGRLFFSRLSIRRGPAPSSCPVRTFSSPVRLAGSSSLSISSPRPFSQRGVAAAGQLLTPSMTM